MSYKDHGGDIYRNPIQYDFSINLNPLGMPQAVVDVLRDSISSWSVYPDPECEALRKALAGKHACQVDQIICGNGAADLIYQLVHALRPGKALIPVPSFSEYERALRSVECDVCLYHLKEKENFRLDPADFIRCITPDTDIVFLCNPNNPNGLLMQDENIRQIAEACRKNHTVLVLDECFMELAVSDVNAENGANRSLSLMETGRKKQKEAFEGVIRIHAFTKTYAMAGLRLGYMILDDPELYQKIHDAMQPWSVSVPAMTAGLEALKEQRYLEDARTLIRTERMYLMNELRSLGYKVYPSDANYILFYTEQKNLYEELLKQELLIRDCSNYEGLGNGYYRVCLKNREANEVLIRALKHL
jgi:threonine-phosphate decarboxylase